MKKSLNILKPFKNKKPDGKILTFSSEGFLFIKKHVFTARLLGYTIDKWMFNLTSYDKISNTIQQEN